MTFSELWSLMGFMLLRDWGLLRLGFVCSPEDDGLFETGRRRDLT